MASASRGSIVQQLQALLGPRDAGDLSDGQLLERYILHHDENAFASLVRRYSAMVWAVCGRVLPDPHDREDAFQATFLVLVRKAASLDRRRPLANWLYTVAYHTALKKRDQAARQRKREVRALEKLSPASGEAVTGNDVNHVVDAELDRLPYRYRAPLILCYLHGKTQEQTATELGWPLGSVKGRLVRARELLRARLERRGVGLSATALTAFLAHNGTAAAPAAVIESTIATALQFAVSEAGGVLALPAATLAGSLLRGMIVTKIQIAAAVV